ncbi:MAG: GGDEF domain-containing response regulator [Bacillota bacterium]
MLSNEINVLIVDDRPENLLVMESLLDDLPCNVIKANSGNDALSMLLTYDVALVLLDVQMPEMDGFEIAELMRGSEKTRDIPIIFVTAINKEQRSIFKGYELGAVDYLFKPVDPYVLKSKVKVFIELNRQKQLLQRQAVLLEDKVNELLELREANYRLESISNIDSLTGIPNRRSFDQYIGMMWSNSIREKSIISIIMIDIDNFKAYNDNYGHLQGDKCLKQVAKCISSTLKRPLDFAGRYGGEEFVVVLPGTDKNGAMLLGEEIRASVEKLGIRHEYSKTSAFVTVSLGAAAIVPDAESSISEFIDKADKALYLSKNEGRNKCTLYNDI